MRRFVPQLLFLLFLSINIAVVLGFIQNPIIYFSRASAPVGLPSEETDPNKSAAVAKLNELSKQINQQIQILTQKKFLQYGYELQFDPSLWEEIATTKTPEAIHSFSLSLKKEIGSATFQISVYSKKDLEASIQTREQELSQNNQLTSKEKIIVSGFPTYKLIIKEKIFGQEQSYEEYHSLANDKYFIFTLKYDQLSNTKPLADTLFSSLTFTTGYPTDVQGVQDKSKKYEAVHIAELVKPSVVNILHVKCKKVVTTKNASFYLKPYYRICSMVKGTGLIVSQEGFVATNGHVVKTYPEQLIVEELLFPDAKELLSDLLKEVTYQVEQKALSQKELEPLVFSTYTNPNVLNSLILQTFELVKKGTISVVDDGDMYFVNLGKTPFLINANKIQNGDLENAIDKNPSIFNASLIDYDYPNRFSSNVLFEKKKPKGSDVALLKLANPNNYTFPTVKLSDSKKLKEGASILIIGYPGVVEGDISGNSLLNYKFSSATPTVTRGIISAIKKDENDKTVIQTDASIERGNSGGPAFDEEGNVVGIVTFGISATFGNYNFLRAPEDVSYLLAKNSISSKKDDVYPLWQRGLENFWNDYYTRSIASFAKVKQLYPLHPTVDEYLKSAQEEVEKGHDKGRIFGIESDFILLLFVSGIGVFLVGLLLQKWTVWKKTHA